CPVRFKRLDVARAVVCTTTELVCCWRRGIPEITPRLPAICPLRLTDLCRCPGFASITAHLDARNGCSSRPRSAPQLHGPALHDPYAGQEVRDPGRDQERPYPHQGYGLARRIA